MVHLLKTRVDIFKNRQNSGFTLLEKMILVAVVGVMGAIAAPNFTALYNRMQVDQAVAEIRGALEETQRQAVRDNKLCNLILDVAEGEVTGDCLVTGERTIPQMVAIATNLLPAATASEEDVALAPASSHDPGAPTTPTTPTAPVVTDTSLGWDIPANTEDTKIALVPETTENLEVQKAAVVIHIISTTGGSSTNSWTQWLCSTFGWFCPDESGEGLEETLPIPVQYGVLGNPQFEIATHLTAPDTPVDPSGKIVLFLPDHPNIEKKCVAISNTLGLTRVGTYTGDISPPDITDSGSCKASNWQAQ